MIRRLLSILQWKRPYDTREEKQFVQSYIVDAIKKAGHEVSTMGPMHNIVVIVGEEKSNTLFSCHTDTVHRTGGRQEVIYDENSGMIYKDDGECLGADDGTGIWLMLHMIEANIPGTYIFHRGEERGGIGSRWMADYRQEFLKAHKRAIAFDRKDTGHIITFQRGLRCCSETFANALAERLGGTFAPNSGGTFTDTANYMHLIPECTNISVGYFDQHTKDEIQDADFAITLLGKVRGIDWETLPTVREAKKETYPSYIPSFGGYSPRSVPPAKNNTSGMPSIPPAKPPGNVSPLGGTSPTEQYQLNHLSELTLKEINEMSYTTLRKAIDKDPEWAADLISELLDEVLVRRKEQVGDIAELTADMAEIETGLLTVDNRVDDAESALDMVLERLDKIEARLEELEREHNKTSAAGAPASETIN